MTDLAEFRYIWKFNQGPTELTLRKISAKGWFTFEYPPNSLMAGEPCRMSLRTFERYLKIGVITLEEPS